MIDYLKEQQRKFEDYGESYRKETNEVFRELTKQLILVATVFLSISTLILNNEALIDRINIIDKHLLSTAWIFLAFSMISGIIQFFIDYFYFRRWTRVKFDIAESIASGEAKEENLFQIAKKKQKNISSESSTVFVWFQVIFLIMGMILLVMTMINFLFI